MSDIDISIVDGRRGLLKLMYRCPTIGYELFLTSGSPQLLEDWTYDMSSSNEHITSVRDETYCLHYPFTMDAGTAIGVTKSDVEGVDVLRSKTTITVTKIYYSLSASEVLLIQMMQCTVNGYDWFNYFAGEVLFVGANISTTKEGYVKVEYRFQVGLFQPGFSVGLKDGSYVSVNMFPFDYLWYSFGESFDAGITSSITKRGVTSVHLARVYDFSDFSLFGFIGPFY